MKTRELLNSIRRNINCPNCGRLLFKAKLTGTYSVQIKCPKCKNIIELSKFERSE